MTRFRTLLLVLYTASVALLAWLVPTWPAASFEPGGGMTWLQEFTDAGILLVTGFPADNDGHRPLEQQLWNVTGRPRRVGRRDAAGKDGTDRIRGGVPGHLWLVRECLAAPDPAARLRELFRSLDAERLFLYALGPDGRYCATTNAAHVRAVTERATGRRLWPLSERHDYLSLGHDDVTYLSLSDGPTPAAVVRRDLATGRELDRRVVPLPPADDDGRALVPMAGGRYVVVHEVKHRRLTTIDVTTGQRVAALDGTSPWCWIDPPGRFLTGGTASATALLTAKVIDPTGVAPPVVLDTCGRNAAPLRAPVVCPGGDVVGLWTASDRDAVVNAWPGWLAGLYRQTLGRLLAPPLRLGFHALADGREVGTIAVTPSGDTFHTGDLAAFSPDGRWVAVVNAVGPGRHRAVVELYAFPLRRPWLLILTWAALPPLALAAFVAILPRLRRPRAATSKGATP